MTSPTPEERAALRRMCEMAKMPIEVTTNAKRFNAGVVRVLDPDDVLHLLDALEAAEADRERLLWYEDRANYIMEVVKAGDGNDQLWSLVSDLCDDWAKRKAPDGGDR